MKAIDYNNKQAEKLAKKLGITLEILGSEYTNYFEKDDFRYVFKLRLKKGGRQYTFLFGQSINNGSQDPTMYDVLSCIQKYDVGSFEDFCSEFGYDEDSRKAEKTYKAVCKEWEAVDRMFNSEELEILQEIQ